MSHADVSIADGELYLWWQLQQPQEVGYCAAALSHLLAHFLLREVAFVDEALVGNGHFDGVKVFAVDVFDEGELKHLLVVGHADEGGNLGESSHLGGAQTAFARDELIFVVAKFSDGNGLNHTLFLDRLSQFAQCGLVKFGAGLERIGFNLVDVDFCNGSGHEITADVTAGDVGFGTLEYTVKAAAQRFSVFVRHSVLFCD